MIEEQQALWELLAVILAVIVAVGSIFGKLTSISTNFLESRRARIRRKNIKGLVLSPTIEEMAKYSIQTPRPYDRDELAHLKRQRAINNYIYSPERLRAEGRLLVLISFFVMICIIVAYRFIVISTS